MRVSEWCASWLFPELSAAERVVSFVPNIYAWNRAWGIRWHVRERLWGVDVCRYPELENCFLPGQSSAIIIQTNACSQRKSLETGAGRDIDEGFPYSRFIWEVGIYKNRDPVKLHQLGSQWSTWNPNTHNLWDCHFVATLGNLPPQHNGRFEFSTFIGCVKQWSPRNKRVYWDSM